MCLPHVVQLHDIILCSWFDMVGGCRSTNTSPGAGGLGHTATMARSASMALAAQAAAAASLRHQTPLTPLSVPSPSPSHATFTYTPGSFTYSGSMSVTPEVLKSRRAELDGTEALSAGAQILLLICCMKMLRCVQLHNCTRAISGNILSFLSSKPALVALQDISVMSFACLHVSLVISDCKHNLHVPVLKTASAYAGSIQAADNLQQAAAQEQQESLTPESRVPPYDTAADQPSTAEESSIAEAAAVPTAVDSIAEYQSSQQQQVTLSTCEPCYCHALLPQCGSCVLMHV